MSDTQEAHVKRGPGRPPKLSEPESLGMKKGVKSWTPANVTEIENKEDGYVYRRISKAPDNITKKKLEGWEIVSGTNDPNTTQIAGYGRINDGKQLTSVVGGTDWILARMSEDMVAERERYFLGETGRRTKGLTAHLRSEMKGEAPVHGEIKISSRTGTQIIEQKTRG